MYTIYAEFRLGVHCSILYGDNVGLLTLGYAKSKISMIENLLRRQAMASGKQGNKLKPGLSDNSSGLILVLMW